MKKFIRIVLFITPSFLFNSVFSQIPYLVKDIYPGTKSAFMEYPVGYSHVLNPINNGVIFRATPNNNKSELWYSDGTNAGTYTLSSSIDIMSYMINDNNYLAGKYYFSANTPSEGYELFQSDGTVSGTKILKDITPGTGGSGAWLINKTANKLYFTANDGTTGKELYISDGTTSGTTFLKDLESGAASSTISTYPLINTVGDNFYFIAAITGTGNELWFTDGTTGGTKMVMDIWPGTGSFFSSSFNKYFKTGGNDMFFVANNGTNGEELWFTNSTTAYMVKDIRPGSTGTTINFIDYINNTLFFMADDGISGSELWRSDGTTAGTYILHDITPGSNGSNVILNNLNNKAYYFTQYSKTLWETDGTVPGTFSVSIPAAQTYTDPYTNSNIFKFNNALYFTVNRFTNTSAKDSILFYKLTSGLVSLSNFKTVRNEKDLYTGCLKAGDFDVVNTNLFRYQYSQSGFTSLRYSLLSDGTSANTFTCGALTNPMTAGNCDAQPVIEINNQLMIFSGSQTLMSGPAGIFSNAIPNGNDQLISTSIFPAAIMSGSITPYVKHNGKIYFRGSSSGLGIELFETDGTPAGTKIVLDINSGSNHALHPAPYSPTSEDYFVTASTSGKLFFLANDGVTGMELWCINGAASGIKETENTLNASLFPNPATDKISIRSKDEMQTISVTDILGKTLMNFEKVKENVFEISTTQLSNGIYFVNIEGSMGTQAVKFIKQ